MYQYIVSYSVFHRIQLDLIKSYHFQNYHPYPLAIDNTPSTRLLALSAQENKIFNTFFFYAFKRYRTKCSVKTI